MGKRRGSPQIPLALRKQLAEQDDELIEKRFVSTTSGKTNALSRKVLRKRQRSEKKLRRQAFHTNSSVMDIKQKKIDSEKPAKKRRKIEEPEKPKTKKKVKPAPAAPPMPSREEQEIEYYEKKLKNYYHKEDHLGDLLDGITAGTDSTFDPDQTVSDDETYKLSDDESSNEQEDSSPEQLEELESSEESPTEDIKIPKAPIQREPKATDAKQKYIPPSLRRKAAEELDTGGLLKKLRGLLNRVSEGNLTAMANEIQIFYETFSRHDVNKQLASCILEDCGAAAVQTTLLPVYAGLIAYLHFTVGTDVGGSFLNYLCIQLEVYASENNKEAYLNCVKIMSFLYNFETIHCSLLFDIIRACILQFTERDIESLLAILKITGLELRSDDPTALKDIICALQERVTQYEESNKRNIGEDFGVRIKYMLDMIYELKNNKKNHFISAKAPKNMLIVVKKARQNSLSEQLQISLKELRASTEKKWWIRGTSMLRNDDNSESQKDFVRHNKLLEIAKKQGMNTDVRRSIFATIMGAEDYLDAFESLLKLGLKGKQDRDIVNVIIHCCVKEKIYNPFYGFLGAKLCSFDYNHKFTFQYNFWDRFKRLEKEEISVVVNLAKLLGYMLGQQALSLSIFKVVEFFNLKPMEIVFYRMVFTRLFCDNPEKLILQLFERFATNEKLFHVREQLQGFFNSAFRKSSLKNREMYTDEEAQKIKNSLADIKMIFRQAPSGF